MVSLLTGTTWCYSIFLLFTFFTILKLPCGAEDDGHYNYNECGRNFTCGHINVSYPFWGNGRAKHCGHEGFELHCKEGGDYWGHPFTIFERYMVLEIDENSSIMTIARMDLVHLFEEVCQGPELSNPFFNMRLDSTVFDYTPDVWNVTIFYNCSDPNPSEQKHNRLPCHLEVPNNRETGLFVNDSVTEQERQSYNNSCNGSIKVPVEGKFENPVIDPHGLLQALKKGFHVKYDVGTECSACMSSGGFCGSSASSQAFACYCQDKPHPQRCPGSRKKRHIIIGVATGAGVLVFVLAAFLFYYQRRKRSKYARTSYTSRSFSSAYSSRTDFEIGGCFGLPCFDYEELRKATENFDQKWEVGDGGFGIVYKGKLRDGRVVAIKRLYENNYKRQEQFMNEVEILARLRHPNLVILYGYTSPHSHRLLLVYEYISNGTVADHLHGDLSKPGSLPWLTRLSIAIETASALLYLHHSDVIHRDVKTYNILLDDNFSVKVADFGLSRLFPFNVTHVSTAPQGTPGYVDPEYHQCYQLTEKSDVYSFGVVLMELISSLPAVDITRQRHEINLSTMAINKIQSGSLHEFVDKHLGFDCDDNTKRMITAVAELAFRCLQDAKEMRPCMEEVLETLKSIQKQDKPTNKAEEMDSLSDDAVLLKRELMRSPDSVMVKLDSTLTTPNASG